MEEDSLQIIQNTDSTSAILGRDLNDFLSEDIIELGSFHLNLYNILSIVFIILITKLILVLVEKFLFNPKRNISKDRKANFYALFQFVRYIAWTIAIVMIMGNLGIDSEIFKIGGGALLVGIGLGMQDLFINFISGIILMVEGSLKVGDILEIDKDVVKISEIGLRTSKGINRNNVSIIIPNSEITNSKVINWSHQRDATRFLLDVGVAYGSDADLVKEILIESAEEHPAVDKKRKISAVLTHFGESSLDFQLVFYSYESFRIEMIKSDIRLTINRKFIENKIIIPFPQMDMHLKEMPKKDIQI